MRTTTFCFQTCAAFVSIALFIAAPPAKADVVGWHDDFGGDIGLGLDLPRQKETKPPVAIFATVASANNTGKLSITARFVQHRLDMVKTFSLNTSIGLSYGIEGGNVNFAMVDKETFSQNTLTFLQDCTRDFGESKPAFLGFNPNFTNTVNSLKQTLNGDALQKAITGLFGTHVVYGYKSAAEVAVVYHFKYNSSAIARSTSLSVAGTGNYDGVQIDFASFVQTQFKQTNTDVSLDAHFWSSDPNLPPPFPVVTNIATYSQFLAYSAQIQNYCASMDPSRAKKTGYLVEPLQSLDGYYNLVGFTPATNHDDPGFDRFNYYYSMLKAWENQLLYWTTDPRHMSWLNIAGQQQVNVILRDVTDYRKTMEKTASAYFATGAPLVVTEDIINYFANSSRIPIPTIYTLWSGEYDCGPVSVKRHLYLGYIYFGSAGLTVSQPIGNVSVYESGVDVGHMADLTDYTAAKFYQDEKAAGAASCSKLVDVINQAFSTDLWLSVTNQAQTNRIVFFSVDEKASDVDAGTYTFVIKDNAFEMMDQVNMLTTRSAGAFGQVAAISPQVNLAVGLQSQPAPNVAGRRTTYTFGVTNNGPGSAYGVQFTLPLINTNTFDIASVSGSQGQGTFTNGGVLFDIGPLASGSTATVQLQVVPVVAGAFLPGSQVGTTPGVGLINPVLADASMNLSSIMLQNPVLSVGKLGGKTALSWQSDTTRILLEQSSGLPPSENWTPVTGSFVTNGSLWRVDLNSTGDKKFFRLHGM